MSLVHIRKRAFTVETSYHEGGPAPERPLRLAAASAVIANPYAGRYEPDLIYGDGKAGSRVVEIVKDFSFTIQKRITY